MITPSIIAKWDKLTLGRKAPPGILSDHHITTAGVIFASIATSSRQLVGDPFNHNRIATRCAGAIHIRTQDGPICHRNSDLAFNMNLIQRGRGILRVHQLLVLSLCLSAPKPALMEKTLYHSKGRAESQDSDGIWQALQSSHRAPRMGRRVGEGGWRSPGERWRAPASPPA